MGFVASKQLARPRCWRGEVGLGASKDPLNQWCISHISPYFSKMYQLALYFSFWGFPLLWPWCTYEVMNHALQISLLGKGTTTWGRHRVWSVNGFTFIVSACDGGCPVISLIFPPTVLGQGTHCTWVCSRWGRKLGYDFYFGGGDSNLRSPTREPLRYGVWKIAFMTSRAYVFVCFSLRLAKGSQTA